MAHNRGVLEKSDEHYTPKWLFDEIGLLFDLDVASPVGGSNVPTIKYYTQIDDGLTQPWSGKVWMNPPFSKPSPWVNKFIENNNGIALLVVSKSKWFKEIWLKADAIIPTPPNFKFDRPDGSNKSISFQTFLFAFGSECSQALHRLEGRVR